MTTPLDKTIKRALTIADRAYVLAVSPDGFKLTLKGHRTGIELTWSALVSGEAALATALNASLGKIDEATLPPVNIPRRAAPAKKNRTDAARKK